MLRTYPTSEIWSAREAFCSTIATVKPACLSSISFAKTRSTYFGESPREGSSSSSTSELVMRPRLHEDLALPRPEETHERVERGGLAGAIGPDDTRDRPAPPAPA